jgi:type II secretory pathway component GspD/PulD (secretin)
LNKRIRSRVLAASIVSTTLFGTGGLLYPQRAARAQDRPTATELLDRGSRLYEQQQFGEAKKILSNIDPAQLPEDQRSKLSQLVQRTDQALAKAAGPNGAFNSAQESLDADKLAAAAKGFQAIVDDASAPADVKEKAEIQLALVKQKQASRAPQMKELLAQAQSLYDQGKLDEAQNALDTIQTVGADLGWDNNPKVPQLESRISEKRMAMARGGAGGGMAAAPAMGDAGAQGGGTAAAPGGGQVAQAPSPMDVVPNNPAPAANPMDMTPGAGGNTMGAPAQGNGEGLLGQVTGDVNARRDRAMTLYNEAKRRSDEALNANPPQFVQAISYAQEALDVLDQNRNYFSDIELDALRDAAQRQLKYATSRRDVFNREQDLATQVETQRNEAARRSNIQAIKQQKVRQLVADANRLVEVSSFKEAADLLRQATVIDPQDENARLMLRLVENKINDRAYEDLVHRRGQETMRQDLDSAEHLIPYADLMIYPDNWLEITRKRVGSDATTDSAANRAARERLEAPLHQITAEQQGLEKVITYLRDNTNTNIFVNWKALEAAGVDRNTPVSVSLREVPFRKALTTILSEVGGGTANLGYTIDDGIITISTRDDLNSAKYQLVKVYDIRDLLVQPTNRSAPGLNLGVSSTSGGATSGGSNGGSLFGSTSGSNNGQIQDPTQQRQQIVTNITDTIKATVAPDSWRDNGGLIGSIRELNGQLIVNQTVDNQVEVVNLLQQLRETRAIQIAVEARLLLVSNNFLDDFRFGWDLFFPAGTIGGSVGSFEVGNINTFNQAVPQTTGVPGSILTAVANPSLSLGATILDNWTLNLLLSATQADKRTVSVTAPRVTIFNGQRGFIAVTQQLNFVQSFNQTVASGGIGGSSAVGTSLNIATLNTGVTLDVEATVSSDRRYVVMNIDPQISVLDGLDTISIDASGALGGNNASTGNNSTSNNNTGNNGTNTTTTVGGAFVQLPKISNTEVSTMVSIPDGGTLLIGGQKLVGESEIEVGVPILSKIPGLNRLFTNRSFVKDERTLLVLVRPTIIIHREIENDLFGVGYDRPTGLPTNTGAEAPTIIPGAVGGGTVGGGL